MKTIFTVKQEFQNIKEVAYDHIIDIYDFNNYAQSQLIEFKKKILDKNMTYMANHPIIKEGLELIQQGKKRIGKEEQRILNNIHFVEKYSKYNLFVWIKRFHNLHQNLLIQLHEQMDYSRYLLSCLKELKEDLEHHHTKSVNEMLRYIDVLREDLLKSTQFKLLDLDCYDYIEQIFMYEPKMSKNNFISLIATHKNKQTQKIISKLPNELTIEDIRKAIFVEMIEGNSSPYLHDLMIKQIFKTREQHPEIANEMDKKLGLDLIPTYSVAFDEFGDVSDVKQNPPKLRLV